MGTESISNNLFYAIETWILVEEDWLEEKLPLDRYKCKCQGMILFEHVQVALELDHFCLNLFV